MARGSNATASDRGRGNSRGRAFKKASSERDSNVESGGHSTSRSKFQESLKNQENSQNKYYDDKRTNGAYKQKHDLTFEYMVFIILQRIQEFQSC